MIRLCPHRRCSAILRLLRAKAAVAVFGGAALLTAGFSNSGAVLGDEITAVGEPYEIRGVRYVPREDPDYEAFGVASWYGSRFHGRLTASGEIFDMHAMTAAHRTLPFGTQVQVTVLNTGKSIILTINDRGPFIKGRVIDISRAAAKRLGMIGAGIARVRVRVLPSSGA